MSLRRTLLAALLCALTTPAAFAAEQAGAAPAVKWVLPWQSGTTLEYANEEFGVDDLGEHEVTRGTSSVTVRILAASEKGFIQAWTWGDNRYEVIEGDKSEEAWVGALATAVDGMTLEVELDPSGNYSRVHNLPAFAARQRQAIRPILLDATLQQVLAEEPDLAMHDAMRAITAAAVDGELDKMFSPEFVDLMFATDIRWYNAFAGIEAVPGKQYQATTELAMDGISAPVPLTYRLETRPESPDDLFVVFERKIDRQVSEGLVIAMIEGELDEGLSDHQKQQELVVLDQGTYIVHRRTGVVEMFEGTRTTRVGDKRKVDRLRLRQLDGAHEHSWDGQASSQGASP